MQPRLSASVALALLLTASAAAASTRVVQGSATAKSYNEVWRKWDNVPLAVYVDDSSNAYIMGTDGGIIKARGFLSQSDTSKVLALLRKSQEWVATAQAKKLEVTKELGRFMRRSDFSENGVALQFFAANEGRQTDVILTLVDFDNQFYRLELYLDPSQVAALIGLLERVPETISELKKHEAAAASLE